MISLSFPDQTYTSSNKPSADTLKADLALIETDLNSVGASITSATTSAEGLVELATTGETTTGTDTTRAVTPAGILAVMKQLNPIGTIREFNVSTNPATLLGFGTWTAYGTGRFTIAIDATDSRFDTVDETGGAETVTLTSTELPAHTHTYSGTTSGQSATHTHTYGTADQGSDGTGVPRASNTGAEQTNQSTNNASADHTHTYSGTSASTGTGSAFAIMNPFITVYRWVRTA